MAYRSLQQCLTDLEKQKMLIRVKEEVDPHLQMAAIHLRVHEAGGPALLFEKVKGTKFTAASNIFGTMERSRYIFRDTLHTVQQLIELKNNPIKALKSPIKNFTAGLCVAFKKPIL
jgi:4-hydroxy-3-polyprenylbenzoate decarboxylase